MQDLNDLYYFVQVVDHGGFAAASRSLGITKSKLSRRIGQLEQRLATRLLNRSTRHFSVTEIGQSYYQHCIAMLVEAEAAQDLIELNQSEPRGLVRLSCSPSVLHYLITPVLIRFMACYPKVEVQAEATSRRVDIVREGFDMAIRIRFPPLEDSDLNMKLLSHSPQRLMASPHLFKERPLPQTPADLEALPSLDFEQYGKQHYWDLTGPEGETAQIRHHPRLVTDSAETLHEAALAGLGVAKLAMLVGGKDLEKGHLIDVLPGWEPQTGILHAVFPSRRGLLPSVRALLDFLADTLAAEDFATPDVILTTQRTSISRDR